MECNYCHSQFNQSANIPKLLVFCGHSLCEMCCRQLHTNNRIQCPECYSNTFIQQINFLPKNLALLKVNHSSSITSNSQVSCSKHEKKYEAFCEKQKLLICVDCILQDGHRNHDMDSIKNSHQKQLCLLEKRLGQLQNQLQQLKNKYKQNTQNQSETLQNYKQSRQKVKEYFNNLRVILEKEEESFLTNIQEQYQVVLKKFENNNYSLEGKVNDVSQCMQTIKGAYTTMNDIMFLESVTTREVMMDSLNTKTQANEKILALSYTINQVGDSFIKKIQKQFKTHIVSQHSNQIAPKKLEPSANNKNFKKNPASNSHTYKNLPKKPARRQTQGSNGSMPQSGIFSSNSQNSNSNSNSNSNNQTPSNGPSITNSNRPSSNYSNHNRYLSQNTGINSKSKEKKNNTKNKPLQKYDINSRCDVSIVEPKQSMFNSFMSNMTSFLLNDKKSIYVVGGFDSQSDNMIKLNLSTMNWEQVSKLRTPRSKFGCISTSDGKDVIIFGGKKGKQRISEAEIWNNNQWKAGVNLKKKRSGFGTIIIDNTVYIVGGNDGDSILNSVESLNLKTGQWKKKQPMIQARDELAICIGSNNKIYAIGGFGGKNNQPLRSAEMYDPIQDKWSSLSPLKIPRRALAAASLADGIYAIGGFDGQKYLNSVERYEEQKNEWIKVANLQKARCTHSAVTIFDSQQIMVFGGFDEIALDSVEKYSLVSNQWEYVTSMPKPRFMHSSVLINQ